MTNKFHPGLPRYTGPKPGYFTLLHHEGPLIEWSDNVMERIEAIDKNKPRWERAIRKAHIVYMPDKMVPENAREAHTKWHDAEVKWRKAVAEWQEDYAKGKKADAEWRKADAEWRKALAKWRKTDVEKLTAYLHKHVKDCRWNGKEIVFP